MGLKKFSYLFSKMFQMAMFIVVAGGIIFITSFDVDSSTDIPDEYRFNEEEFNPEHFEERLLWLNNNFLPVLEPYIEVYFKWREHFSSEDAPIPLSKPEFEKLPYLWEYVNIGMPNFQAALKGIHLRQQARIAELEYEVLKLKEKSGEVVSAEEIDMSRKRMDIAKQRFQEFLERGHRVD